MRGTRAGSQACRTQPCGKPRPDVPDGLDACVSRASSCHGSQHDTWTVALEMSTGWDPAVLFTVLWVGESFRLKT